jgi:hypothetical protein
MGTRADKAVRKGRMNRLGGAGERVERKRRKEEEVFKGGFFLDF